MIVEINHHQPSSGTSPSGGFNQGPRWQGGPTAGNNPIQPRTHGGAKHPSVTSIGGGELGLARLLDAAITTQKIALDSLVKISYLDDVDHGALEEYLENNLDVLDACNYFVERIWDVKKYVDTLRVVPRLVDSSGSFNPRVLELLESCGEIEKKRCKEIRKHGLCLRRILRQKLGHDETEFSEIVCGSKVMALLCCRFLELGLSFDSKCGGFPSMKQCHPKCCSSSWLLGLAEQAEGKCREEGAQEEIWVFGDD
ncbi:hypothetical protein SESBI_43068 [Sesbania bispinosa]|nr:hypothetical protein SESBI_43068 [Sesbania bispinosa]